MKSVKPKSCKICKRSFVPRSTTAQVCGMDCAIKLTEQKNARNAARIAKESRVAHRQAIKAAKPRGEWLKEAQATFNAWIRARDEGLPCISCGTMTGQRHASHFYATSIRPNLRFDEQNVHTSCAKCNKWMHGNLVPYRQALLVKIGADALARLDADIQPKHYSIPELKEIQVKYRKLTRGLKKAAG